MNFDPFSPFTKFLGFPGQKPPDDPKLSSANPGPVAQEPILLRGLSPIQRVFFGAGATPGAESPPSPPTGFPGDSTGIQKAQAPLEQSQPTNKTQPKPFPENKPWQPPGWSTEEILKGGPGALFGQPQPGWNLGDALGGAGVALIARDNPTGAEQLSQSMLVQKALQKISTHYNENTGQAIRQDRYGNVSVEQVAPPRVNTQQKLLPDGYLVTFDERGNIINRQQAYTPEAKPVPVGVMKLFDDNDGKGEASYNALKKNHEFIRLLQQGKLNLSAVSRAGSNWRLLLDNSDEGTRNAAAFQAHLEEMRGAKLLDAKGVQTEGDAERAMEAILPGNTALDNKSVASLLRQLNTGFASAWQRYHRHNQGLIAQYPTYDPDGYYRTRYEGRLKDYEAARSAIEQGWDAFVSPPAPPGDPRSSTPVTGANPGRRPRNAQGESLLEFSQRRDRERQERGE